MTLASAYVQAHTRVPALLAQIRDGQAPEQFTQQLLKDIGFGASSDRAFIPLLKQIGFLSPDGKPTSRYHEYRDHSRSKHVLGEALREAYSDLFLIKAHPTETDRAAIEGKFKSFHNCSELVAKLMANTFFALLKEAELTPLSHKEIFKPRSTGHEIEIPVQSVPLPRSERPIGLQYNIQIHLPPTKDIEVYNAIFKSLKEHLLNE